MFKTILRWAGMIVGGALLGVLIAFLFGWAVMLLWNWLMPPLFGLPTIGFWKAWGIVILSHILFKSGSGHHSHRHSHPEWKSRFKLKIEDHLGSSHSGAEDKTA